ncbi:unnamed protein product [Strongylus vulgaris]|uniref:Peptidase C1A papain C-terminal domain-containing protein n=1 Tax=Strongylus vulgaris TaxID=40348 RepID=A0A3P7LIM4_STRVU|nr:unnamed protein product [Strongylus vulgaris]
MDFDVRTMDIKHLDEEEVHMRADLYQGSFPITTEENLKAIPEEFDARNQWGNCWSLKEVRDQSNCGSCWAVSTASAASDRLCIAKGWYNEPDDPIRRSYQTYLSDADIMTCCKECMRKNGNKEEDGYVYNQFMCITLAKLIPSLDAMEDPCIKPGCTWYKKERALEDLMRTK